MQSSAILPHKLQLRDRSSIFPPALPPHYEFLARPPIQHRINIKHPGYERGDDDLLTLYAWDHADGGLHYGFILDICNVTAGNRPGGYLSTTRGGQAIEAEADALLRPGNYYFHIPDPAMIDGQASSLAKPYRWAVVSCFRDWPFPESISPRWTKQYLEENVSFTSQQSTYTSAVRGRDRTCRISSHFSGTQVAHLVPQHESEWFRRNSMSVYNVDLTLDADNLLNDLSNLVLLRSDIHTGFDERKFLFYPKGQASFVVHMLEPSPDLAQLYHNVPVQMPFSCHPYFLYTHLAWAVLPSLAGFWSKPGIKRVVLMCIETENGRELVEKEIMVTPEFHAKITSSRSRSPKKRSRTHDESTERLAPDNKRARLQENHGQPEPNTVVMAPHDRDSSDESDGNDENDETCSAVDATIRSLPRALPHDNRRALKELSPQASQLCPSWYPEHQKIDAIRKDWLSKERQKNTSSTTAV